MTDATSPFPTDGLRQDDDAASKRTRRRDSLFLSARLSFDGRAPVEVRVRNLSEGGLMAEGAPPLTIGTAVAVELRNLGSVPGRVAWYTDNRAGISFDVEIDPKRARKPVAVKSSGASGRPGVRPL